MTGNAGQKIEIADDTLDYLASKVTQLKEDDIKKKKTIQLAKRIQFPKTLLIFTFVYGFVFLIQIFDFSYFIKNREFAHFIPFTVFMIILGLIGFIFLCMGYRFGAIIWTCCLPWNFLMNIATIDIKNDVLPYTARKVLMSTCAIIFIFMLTIIWCKQVREYYAAKCELRERILTLADNS